MEKIRRKEEKEDRSGCNRGGEEKQERKEMSTHKSWCVKEMQKATFIFRNDQLVKPHVATPISLSYMLD